MENVGIFYVHLVYFTAVWYMYIFYGKLVYFMAILYCLLLSFSICYIFPFWYLLTKKNLAALGCIPTDTSGAETHENFIRVLWSA
jgi:hypothetical protein